MQVSDLVEELQRKASQGEGVNSLTMYTGITVITKISEFVIGLMSTILLIVIPLVVALELIYINMPVVRSVADKIMDRGTGHVQKAVKFSLRDAIKAVEMANTIETGKSANFIYLGLKMKWIYVVMFCVVMVIGGGTLIVKVLMSILSGLIDVVMRAISLV